MHNKNNTMKNDNSYTIDNIRDFDPVHTFECGQCFRWEKQDDGSYTGAAMGKIVNMRFDFDADFKSDVNADAHTGSLTITPCTEAECNGIWRPYLDLDRDYGAIKAKLSENDGIMKKACEYGFGIRILKQDLWETIISFIISQNNNIPRIKGCIERLCDNFGEPISRTGAEPAAKDNPTQSCESTAADVPTQNCEPTAADAPGSTMNSMPAAETLAGLSVEDLAPVRLGYRAKYLIETARAVCENGLPKSPEELSELCGVGPKVASCIALFGMQDYASFPIDVWVMKVMHELYGLPEGNKKQMAEFAREKFGELGGFAQQYLFYYMRDRS